MACTKERGAPSKGRAGYRSACDVSGRAEEMQRSRLKVLVATDNHLGYLEKDEVRGQDSFRSFEEIFQMAREYDVDMVLLGGDLFHHNKPSQSTLVKCMQVIRKYCLGERPVQFQVVSDQSINFPSQCGRVNFEDPNVNMAVPVFSIHGNHDDPAGAENLSALDILASCNLVNYFGKSSLCGEGTGKVKLNPVLIRKGNTNVALYGMGHIRDERLHRMFQAENVEWVRPPPTDTCAREDWFNIFVIHQNRVGHSMKNCIPETFLPSFLDFVVWGHEHECLVEPQQVAHFHVTQPGSSVATSLMEGEAQQKHVLLLEVMNFGKETTKWRTTKIPLKTVRPFEFQHVVLQDELDAKKNDVAAIEDLLYRKVQQMIESSSVNGQGTEARMLPLVRLRVDYTGFTTINTQRFGQRFVGKVANPQDLLLFTKSASRKSKSECIGMEMDVEMYRPETLDQATIEALIAENLTQSLQILGEEELGAALHSFVDKDERNALGIYLKDQLERTTKAACAALEDEAGNISEVVAQVARTQVKVHDARYAAGLNVAQAEGPLDNVLCNANGQQRQESVEQRSRDSPRRSLLQDMKYFDGSRAEHAAEVLPPVRRSSRTVKHKLQGNGSPYRSSSVDEIEDSEVSDAMDDSDMIEVDSEDDLLEVKKRQVPAKRRLQGKFKPRRGRHATIVSHATVCGKQSFTENENSEEVRAFEDETTKRPKHGVTRSLHAPSGWDTLK